MAGPGGFVRNEILPVRHTQFSGRFYPTRSFVGLMHLWFFTRKIPLLLREQHPVWTGWVFFFFCRRFVSSLQTAYDSLIVSPTNADRQLPCPFVNCNIATCKPGSNSRARVGTTRVRHPRRIYQFAFSTIITTDDWILIIYERVFLGRRGFDNRTVAKFIFEHGQRDNKATTASVIIMSPSRPRFSGAI